VIGRDWGWQVTATMAIPAILLLAATTTRATTRRAMWASIRHSAGGGVGAPASMAAGGMDHAASGAGDLSWKTRAAVDAGVPGQLERPLLLEAGLARLRFVRG
jgi:hypothetical protein